GRSRPVNGLCPGIVLRINRGGSGIASTVEDMAEHIGGRLTPPLGVAPWPAGAAAAPIVLAGVAGAMEDLLVLDVWLQEIGEPAAHQPHQVGSIAPAGVPVWVAFGGQVARSAHVLIVVLLIHLQGGGDLLEVADTTGAARFLTRLCEDREEDCCEYRN